MTKRKTVWPVQNFEPLAIHVARQFPEITIRQARAFLRYTFFAILRSLETQSDTGVDRPRVYIPGIGVFELRWRRYQAKKNRLGGGDVEVPGHWKLLFRPADKTQKRLKGVSARARTSRLERTGKEDPETDSWVIPRDARHQENAPRLSDMPADGGPGDLEDEG